MSPEDLKRLQAYLTEVAYPGYTFVIREGHAGVFLQASYLEKDVNTGDTERQYTRKWIVTPFMTKSEVVQTAFKCVLTSAEHRVREWFRYQDKPIFGPHFDVDDLVQLQQRGGRT